MGRGKKYYYSKDKERFRQAEKKLQQKYKGKLGLLEKVNGLASYEEFSKDVQHHYKIAKSALGNNFKDKLLNEERKKLCEKLERQIEE